MPQEVLNKIKELEKIVKKFLINKYGSFMPQDKITVLNETTFINDEILKGINNIDEAQSIVIRSVVGNAIDLMNNAYIEEKNFYEYKNFINDGLKEYYSQEIANELGFSLTEMPALKNNYELIALIKQRLDEGLDKSIFSNESIKLMEADELEKLLRDNKNMSIEEFVKQKEAALATEIKEEGIEAINEQLSDKSRLNLVYIEGKQYLKYVDQDNNVHMIDTKNSKLIGDAYRNGFANLNKDEQVDVDKFYAELLRLIDEIKFKKLDEIDLDAEGKKEVDMIAFTHANKNISRLADGNDILHSDDADIHIIEESNKIVTTKYHPDYIESNIIEGNNTGMTLDGSQEQTQDTILNDERIITHEEYEELYAKLSNGDVLTLDEIRLMENYQSKNPDVLEIEKDTLKNARNNDTGPKLVPKKKYNYYGYANFYEMIYIAAMSIGIATILILTVIKIVR